MGPIAFTVELRRPGGRWLVDAFFPTAIFPKVEDGGQPLAAPDLGPTNVQGTSQVGKARVSQIFFLTPLVIVGIALAIPLALFLHGMYRERRAERLYARTPRAMPPPPKPRAQDEREREHTLTA